MYVAAASHAAINSEDVDDFSDAVLACSHGGIMHHAHNKSFPAWAASAAQRVQPQVWLFFRQLPPYVRYKFYLQDPHIIVQKCRSQVVI